MDPRSKIPHGSFLTFLDPGARARKNFQVLDSQSYKVLYCTCPLVHSLTCPCGMSQQPDPMSIPMAHILSSVKMSIFRLRVYDRVNELTYKIVPVHQFDGLKLWISLGNQSNGIDLVHWSYALNLWIDLIDLYYGLILWIDLMHWSYELMLWIDHMDYLVD